MRYGPRGDGPGRPVAREVGVLVALASVGLVTALWWAFALWPVSQGAAPALERARYVCFGTDPGTGLPDATGWALLVGQPVLMLSLLLAIWGGAVREVMVRLMRSGGGRMILAGAATLALAGLTLVSWRVSTALADVPPAWAGAAATDEVASAAVRPRLDRTPPTLELESHRGELFTLEEVAGRPALVTFAYGHCATICPLVVRNASEAARHSELDPALVVVTLDPWRDVPSRLPGIAEGWGIAGPHQWLLGGDLEAVEATLDAWNVARERDVRTGEITHPALTYVLDARGKVAFASRGSVEELAALLERLRARP